MKLRAVQCELIDLGDTVDPKLRGILAPKGEVSAPVRGVTSQFTDNAAIYHQKYFDTSYSNWLLAGALKRIGPLPSHPIILDVGSGSGPSVLSLLRLVTGAEVYATDISYNLLNLLKAALISGRLDHRVKLLALDLNRRWLSPNQFDLAVGVAILHHLFDPELLVSQVYATLKPGASMIFFEPFETGHVVLCLLYQQILQASVRTPSLDNRMREFFIGRIREFALRKCEPKPVKQFEAVDDKWAFTRAYFARIGERLGAARLQVDSLSDPTRAPFRAQVVTDLRLGLGQPAESLPKWAWDIVDDFECRLSADAKSDLLLEGSVIITK
jgi:SAM-dependent methyltransferase